MAHMTKSDIQFENWIRDMLVANPAGLSDIWLRAARSGWDAAWGYWEQTAGDE